MKSVVVIGAGFIGLEAAAALTMMGKSLTVLESMNRVLMRGAAEPLADYVTALHARKGVRICTGRSVTAFKGTEGRVVGVVDSAGTYYVADTVIVGVGVQPNTELAEGCGLRCVNGIEVDQETVTSDPLIVAAGDCTAHPNAYADGALLRLESVQNALDQAKTAGGQLAGAAMKYDAVPWFWSDQFDVKFQMAGLSTGYDKFAVRGDRATGRFSIIYFRRGAVCAIDSINRPADHMIGRKLVAASSRVSQEQAADLSFDLRTLI